MDKVVLHSKILSLFTGTRVIKTNQVAKELYYREGKAVTRQYTSGMLSELVKLGKLERVSRGQYRKKR